MDVKGCLFHFTEALRKKFETEPIRLKVEYDERGEVWQFIRRCVPIAFVPDFMDEDVWNDHLATFPTELADPDIRRKCQLFADYFHYQWLRRVLPLR